MLYDIDCVIHSRSRYSSSFLPRAPCLASARIARPCDANIYIVSSRSTNSGASYLNKKFIPSVKRRPCEQVLKLNRLSLALPWPAREVLRRNEMLLRASGLTTQSHKYKPPFRDLQNFLHVSGANLIACFRKSGKRRANLLKAKPVF